MVVDYSSPSSLLVYGLIDFPNGFTYQHKGRHWWRVGAWKVDHQAGVLLPHIASPLIQQLLNKRIETE